MTDSNRITAPKTHVRRTGYMFFHLSDGGFLDINSLLAGRVRIKPMKQLVAISILNGKESAISIDDLRLLFRIPSDNWTPVSELLRPGRVSVKRLREFALKGLLVSNEPAPELRKLRRRDEALSGGAWNIYAALYHFMTKWSDVNLHLDSPNKKRSELIKPPQADKSGDKNLLREFINHHGKPPHHFHTIKRARVVRDLPVLKKRSQFYDVLMSRRTTRSFKPEQSLPLNQLAIILYYAFGCHGYSEIFEDIMGLKKTSPSGGGLHPTEVYVLLINVEEFRPGLYHYNVRDHSLELLRTLTKGQAVKLADEFTAGQGFPADAHALFIMTTRFYRNYWKYRMHRKAYSVLLMDVAHLSQTFYLVCAELGLGAFVTAAINHTNIEKNLGLDGFTEGAIAISGCGTLAAKNDFDPVFLPYMPRKTRTTLHKTARVAR